MKENKRHRGSRIAVTAVPMICLLIFGSGAMSQQAGIEHPPGMMPACPDTQEVKHGVCVPKSRAPHHQADWGIVAPTGSAPHRDGVAPIEHPDSVVCDAGAHFNPASGRCERRNVPDVRAQSNQEDPPMIEGSHPPLIPRCAQGQRLVNGVCKWIG